MKLQDRMRERIKFHQDRVRAYELVLADMNGHLTAAAEEALPAKLQQAIQLRAAVNGERPVKPRFQAQQERQAILKEFIQPDQIYKANDFRKLLKSRGHVPSAKTLHEDLHVLGLSASGNGPGAKWTADGAGTRKKKPASKVRYTTTVKQQRAKTAKLIAKLDKMAQPFPFKVIGRQGAVLMRHGYVKKEGDGYVRTDKPFTA